MRTYKHINDCWNAIRDYWENQETTTVEYVHYGEELCGNIPNKFGEWTVEDQGCCITVTNRYYDSQLDDWYEDSEEFELDMPSSLFLEKDELINCDEALNNIAVDKCVFDGFEQDAIIGVRFIDVPGEPEYEYQMVSEDDCAIYMIIFA